MIRIKEYLINERNILYMDKYGFFQIRVVFTDVERPDLYITYETEEERDAAFESIDQFGRD